MKKQQIKGLKELSKMLPRSVEMQPVTVVKKGYEFTMEEIEKSNIPIEAEMDYKQKGNFRIVEIDHLNRLKKAYVRAKEKGLRDYIYWVDKNNEKMNTIFEKLELQRVSQELIDVADKGDKGFWSNLMNFLFAFLHIFKKKVA